MRESLAPPGETTEVIASHVLVLAPHYDDEVLGCGGLLLHLIRRGARVRVLFVSDGSGGREGATDEAAYSASRKQEADKVADLLGISQVLHLDLPDGQLMQRRAEIARGIERTILADEEAAPDLLLVPSPLEVTEDHQATFGALHDLLSRARGEERLARIADGLLVLAYEINHPCYPNLLVDVGDTLEGFEQAMRLYASQQERHDYLAAGLGLRQYRTHSLGPEVRAAEGYFRLDPSDFRTRSLAQLIRHMGGLPERLDVSEGPLVSVVVRTHDRPQLLEQALTSIADSTYRTVEVVLVRDGGPPASLPGDFPFPVTRIDFEDNRGRAQAANAGVDAATGEWVCFLDDDDLFAPEHLETLVGAVSARDVGVVYSDAAVAIYELSPDDGWTCIERRLPYSQDFDYERLLLDNYIPFNTLLIERNLFLAMREEDGQVFDNSLPFFEDWDALIRLAGRSSFRHLNRVTCEYRHFRDQKHHVLGGDARKKADFERLFLEMKTAIFEKHEDRLKPATLAKAVTELRNEMVELKEALRSARFELDGERRARFALEAETQRLYDAEAELRAVVDEQTEHLGRTYAEIERLGALIREMESTRAWRLHQRFSRSTGKG